MPMKNARLGTRQISYYTIFSTPGGEIVLLFEYTRKVDEDSTTVTPVIY